MFCGPFWQIRVGGFLWIKPRWSLQKFLWISINSTELLFSSYVLQSKKNSETYDSLFVVLPVTSITVILFLYLLSFSAMALIVAMVFDFQDRLRPWLITRHSCIVWLSIFVGVVFYFHSLGLIPFYLTNFIALMGFLTILIVDICLAKSVLYLKNGTAILTGCGINLVGLSIILTSLNWAA